MNDLRRSPLHRALHRPNLILGGERKLVIAAGFATIGPAITCQNIVAAIVGVALWIVSLAFLRAMAKADPQMFGLYMRQRKYAGYYAPRATPFGAVWSDPRKVKV